MKPLRLSSLEAQSPPPLGDANARLALELRIRAVEEENRALRQELSRPLRNSSASYTNITSKGNQSRTHLEEGTSNNDGQKNAAVGNNSNCLQHQLVDKCEVRKVFGLPQAHHSKHAYIKSLVVIEAGIKLWH